MTSSAPSSPTPAHESPFQVGKAYARRNLHRLYGGQSRGGIATPRARPWIMCFTGESGRRHGYADHWDDEGVFHFYGEGQAGDMTFTKGNRAIRDHVQDGRVLLVFATEGKGKPVRYRGEYACAGTYIARAADSTGQDRAAIVFQLVPVGSSEAPNDTEVLSEGPLEELRRRAYEAAQPPQPGTPRLRIETVRKRSAIVREYVLRRAGGRCQACDQSAPFTTVTGRPYLEPHHTKMLSEDGLDHPDWVAAVCPNCHREAHFGAYGTAINERLQGLLRALRGRARVQVETRVSGKRGD